MLMTETLFSYLDLAQRYLPVATTSAPSFSAIVDIAQALPPLPLTIFESHLDDPRPDVDFLLSATPKQLLNQLPSGHHVKEWAAIQELCQIWQNLPESDPFRQAVLWLWLEFDTSANRKNSDSPAIYFLEGFAHYNRERVKMVEITAVLKRLLERDPTLAMQKQFARIFQALPSSGRLFSLGNMSGRDSTAVRVSLAGIPASYLVQYLHDIAWPGDLSEIEALIASYSPFLIIWHWILTLENILAPKLG
ncbi:MAG: hypothetical protein HC804_07725 [Anaerolineae bacterium]|nr:hypothetical protein [Anaerolineae bacterium]